MVASRLSDILSNYVRNALRGNPELVAEYGALKRALAERHRYDRDAYTEAKTGFIRSVISMNP